MTQPPSSPLDWSHAVTDIPAGGLSRERAASDQDRTRIAEALGLVSLSELKTDYRITKLSGDGYRLAGTLDARLEQACVVSLEPIQSVLTEEFDVEFRREVEAHAPDHDARVLEGRDQELIEGGVLDAGRIVFETLSAALDPYPRKEGAEFEWTDKRNAGDEKSNPFAVLRNLKDKP